MKRNIRNTGLVFLLIATVAFLLHSVIPHDHHYDDSCEKHQSEKHQDKEPVHCHLLNHIVLEKHVLRTEQSKLTSPVLILFSEADYKLLLSQKSTRSNAHGSRAIIDSFFFITISPTRGSPVLS